MSNLVTVGSLSNIRNDFTGSAGFKFTVGASNLNVDSLGRYQALGTDSATHTVVITKVSDLSTIASVSIGMSGATLNTFKYVAISGGPVTLLAGVAYYLASSETSAGDSFYDYTGCPVTLTADATLNDPFYFDTVWHEIVSAGKSYGPLDLTYTLVSRKFWILHGH